MATQKELTRQIFYTIDEAIGNFNSAIPDHQRQLLAEIEVLLKGLELNGNNIKQSVNNLKLIAAIKNKLEQAVNSPAYLNDVRQCKVLIQLPGLRMSILVRSSAIYAPRLCLVRYVRKAWIVHLNRLPPTE